MVRRTHKTSSSTLLAASPARCSPAQPGPCLPMSPASSALWRPGESQQKAKEPEGYLMWYLTIASVLASLLSTVPTLYSAHLFVVFFFSPVCSLLHNSAFLLEHSFCLLFFTSELTELLIQEENSKLYEMALQATTEGRLKGKRGKAALRVSIRNLRFCYFCGGWFW